MQDFNSWKKKVLAKFTADNWLSLKIKALSKDTAQKVYVDGRTIIQCIDDVSLVSDKTSSSVNDLVEKMDTMQMQIEKLHVENKELKHQLHVEARPLVPASHASISPLVVH